jgi:hypothetical protein
VKGQQQRKRLESSFNTAYSVVKAGKPFSDYELICEMQVKNGLDLGENYSNINGCSKTFAYLSKHHPSQHVVASCIHDIQIHLSQV